jgi:hypothetical protein
VTSADEPGDGRVLELCATFSALEVGRSFWWDLRQITTFFALGGLALAWFVAGVSGGWSFEKRLK